MHAQRQVAARSAARSAAADAVLGGLRRVDAMQFRLAGDAAAADVRAPRKRVRMGRERVAKLYERAAARGGVVVEGVAEDRRVARAEVLQTVGPRARQRQGSSAIVWRVGLTDVCAPLALRAFRRRTTD